MSIYIPFQNYQEQTGGPATFMRNLKAYLDSVGYVYHEEYKKGDNIFFPIEFDYTVLDQVKENGGQVIQRLDGVYYPEKHGKNSKEIGYNKHPKHIYENYSDYIVFQSQYSKKQVENVFGPVSVNSEIIVNGVDKNVFYAKAKSKSFSKKEIVIATSGVFRNIDMLEPVVKAFDGIQSNYKIKLKILGPITNPELKGYANRDYISTKGKLSLEEVAEELRSSDVFIYSHLNPPCPNSVLEAVSTALPVVGFKSGAMSELLWFNQDLLAEVSSDTLQTYDQFDYLKLANKIVLTIDSLQKYKEIAYKHKHKYTLTKMGQAYVQLFKSIDRR